jgi:hypothetical protein
MNPLDKTSYLLTSKETKEAKMKKYIKPVILSEEILEKTALDCSDYAYYTKMTEVCYDEYIGSGKISTDCATTHS